MQRLDRGIEIAVLALEHFQLDAQNVDFIHLGKGGHWSASSRS